ncbi:hypothetical protein EV426DRAFT_721563 [Tirmania nivea]|nr:hypothetical protein EV426DRAFT_721563 [Tirmania nivea]
MEIEYTRKETRGRPPKSPPPLVHPRTQRAREQAAPKLLEIHDLFSKHVGNMRIFLREWSVNDALHLQRDNFMSGGGCKEIIETWLPLVKEEPKETICDLFLGYVEDEVNDLCRDTSASAVLRYSKKHRIEDSISIGMAEMEDCLRKEVPLLWRGNTDKVIVGAIAGMLNSRNQLINAFQTMMGIFFYADNLSKLGMEVVHRLGWSSSYAHVNDALRKPAIELKTQAAKDALVRAMLVSLDNVNKMVGVRDATSIRAGGVMVNSTGGFCTPVFGMPPGHRYIPREWMRPATRVALTPQDLEPSEKASEVMQKHNEWYMVQLLHRCSRSKGDFICGENEFQKPMVEQSSTEGNLRGISRVLMDELKIPKDDFMQGIFLVGGDQLLAERVRGIQKQREGDVPGEDFSGVLPVLGAFHTNMNFKKMMMKMFLGDKSGGVLGSLQNLNKKLRRKYVDEKVGNYWACVDFTKDAGDTVLLGLIVQEGDVKTWDEFRGKSKMGEIRWRQVVTVVSNKLGYKHVSNLRDEEEDSRDHVDPGSRCWDNGVGPSVVGPTIPRKRGTKYGPELVELRCGMLYEWDEQLRVIIRRNWVINPRGRTGKNLGLDEFMEELVRAYKHQYNPGGSETLKNHQRNIIARCAIHLMGLKDEIRCALGIRKHSGDRTKQESIFDVKALLDTLLQEEVVAFIAGRGKKTAEEVGIVEVEDVMSSGLEKTRHTTLKVVHMSTELKKKKWIRKNVGWEIVV